MKKIISLLLVVVLLFGVTGCVTKKEKKEVKEKEETKETDNKVMINGYDMTLSKDGSFDKSSSYININKQRYKLSFKYPESCSVLSSLITSEMIGVEDRDNPGKVYFNIVFGSFYGTSVDSAMGSDIYTFSEKKNINNIEWSLYKNNEGRRFYATNYDYTNYVIGFNYTDAALDELVDNFVNTITLNK